MVILEFDFKSLNDKIVNSAVSLLMTQAKTRDGHFSYISHVFERILERERTSL